MANIREVLRIDKKKGNMTNNLEIFYIYKVTRLDNQINGNGTVKYDVIFDKIIQRHSYRGHLSL